MGKNKNKKSGIPRLLELAGEKKTSKKENTTMNKTIKIEGMMCGHCEATVKMAEKTGRAQEKGREKARKKIEKKKPHGKLWIQIDENWNLKMTGSVESIGSVKLTKEFKKKLGF